MGKEYLADPTSSIPSHCASIVATSTLRFNMAIYNMFKTHFNMIHNVIIHLCGHVEHVMIGVVIHYGICEHKHHVSLEFRRRTDGASLYVLLYRHQIFRPERVKYKKRVLSDSVNGSEIHMKILWILCQYFLWVTVIASEKYNYQQSYVKP